MKKVYISIDRLMVGHIKNLLENQTIPCTVRNEHVSNLPGYLPVNEILPEIWILDDSRYKEARTIIEEALDSTKVSTGSSWECSNCKEILESQFSECWKCGEIKPEGNLD